MNNLEHEAHKRIVSIILKIGERFKKKHGEWIRVKLYSDYWLIMDSWNKSVKVVKGACVYDNIYTGFNERSDVEYLGGDFGGFNAGAKSHRVDYFANLASANNRELM